VLGALEERRRGQPLVVIGVHSAKFDAEQEPERIREAMARHGVRHPVVVDQRHRIWQAYAVRSWPTLVVVRPDGTLAAVAPGEAEFEALDAFVGRVMDEARADGTLARAPFAPDQLPPEPPGALSFPGKVIALPDGGLAVSDSGQHRVVVCDAGGGVRQVVGSGEPGLRDGPVERAQFRAPQGLASDGERLYVADTGNHAVRAIDLRRGVVGTLAGTGRLGRGLPRGTAPARDVDLRSPWDLALAGDYLLVAMAGTHQVWALHLEHETLHVLAGSGREGLADGPFHTAALAQPSGLALHEERLYVADSETSAVRYLDLGHGQVQTLVGKGLFDFGDRDGARDQALLQHPLAVSHGPAGLLVADTYNNKIKHVDEHTGAVSTWFEASDGVSLREPGGLCQLADGSVIVADTNHHRLVRVVPGGIASVIVADTNHHRLVRVVPGGIASVIELRGLASPAAPQAQAAAPGVVVLRAAEVAPGDVTLRVRFELPAGCALTEGSRLSLRLRAGDGLDAPAEDQGFEVQGAPRGVPVKLRAGDGAADAWLELHLDATVCRHGDSGACWPVEIVFRQAVRVVPGSPRRTLDAHLPLPAPAGGPTSPAG
jgi:sugar lactone lactonase YvrE